ncbi:nucleotide pyrophosphohydrolase [Cellulomonas sp. 179-A 4D5 NHS]|uniref:nucleotide pyrophosphohydrolase n=1 Tax=Cellulomonas sp. 179-A 4D5 NHS TaxID=3142378 RepID=UPI0039A12928
MTEQPSPAPDREQPHERAAHERPAHERPAPAQPEREIAELTRLVREFVDEREWAPFQDPKSLALALVGEVGELAELLQWVPADGAVERFTDPARRQRIGEELSDVLVYLLRLADVLGVDLGPAARDKLAGSHRRFAADEWRGRIPEKS